MFESLKYLNLLLFLQDCVEIGSFRGPDISRIVFDRLPPQSFYIVYVLADRKEQESEAKVSYEMTYTWDRGGNDYRIEEARGWIGENQLEKSKKNQRDIFPNIMIIFMLMIFVFAVFSRRERVWHYLSNISIGKKKNSVREGQNPF